MAHYSAIIIEMNTKKEKPKKCELSTFPRALLLAPSRSSLVIHII